MTETIGERRARLNAVCLHRAGMGIEPAIAIAKQEGLLKKPSADPPNPWGEESKKRRTP